MRIIIRNSAGVPIYEQIREQIKAEILSGALQEGEALPSIRQLARDLKISVITTSRAYADLEQEGFLVGMQGKGFFVMPQNLQLVREQALCEMEAQLLKAIASARRAGLSQEEVSATVSLLLKEEYHASDSGSEGTV